MSEENKNASAESTEEEATESSTEPGTGEETDHEAEIKKWKSLSRKHEAQAKANAEAAKRLAKIEEDGKTEQQKLADQLEAAKAESSKANAGLLRLTVALDKAPEGMSVKKIRSLAKRLSGDTQEELEEDAEELFAEFHTDDAADGDEEDGDKPKSRRPQERLKPGASPDSDPEPTSSELADAITKRSRGY